ncbi:MAG: DUF6537 domain-containing protein, partial [Burkholderiales bacterium]
LDQTGLAQKGGAVISDIKISSRPFDGSNKISDASTDLYLGFDILNATDQKNLDKCHPQRTIAVVSTGQAPTGYMVADKNVHFPAIDSLTGAIDRATRKNDNVYLNGQGLAEGLFADNMATNMFMVGAAYQSGALPVSAVSIEQVIGQAGVAIEMGLLAFKWGRMAVVDPEFVQREIRKFEPGPVKAPALSIEARAIVDSAGAAAEVRRLLEIRVPDLIGYQNPAYARRYADAVKRVVQAERQKTPGLNGLSEAAARYLYKLMAYKDEYEVARLQCDAEFLAQLERQFKPGYKVRYHLAPPLLSRRDPVTGELQKRQYGPWVLTVFKLLAKLKFLRGGALDIFGSTAERRHERQMIEDYVTMLDEICANLSFANHDIAVQLASIPNEIRGYGHIKEQSIKAAKSAEQKLLEEFRNPHLRYAAA